MSTCLRPQIQVTQRCTKVDTLGKQVHALGKQVDSLGKQVDTLGKQVG